MTRIRQLFSHRVAIASAIAGIAMAAGITAAVAFQGGETAIAQPSQPFDPRALSAVAPNEPRPVIDTSIEGWYEPYMKADAEFTRSTKTINGFTLGPEVGHLAPPGVWRVRRWMWTSRRWRRENGAMPNRPLATSQPAQRSGLSSE